MKALCELFGHGRQAWYEAQKRSDQRQTQQQSLLAEVKRIREKHPKVGAQKLYFQLRGWCEQNGVKIGRDKFLNLLRTNGLMIYRRARKAVTTNSKHDFYRYPNLVKGIKVTGPNQLWVSDITYLRLPRGFTYLSLITDAYSRKIVGWAVHDTLQTEGPLSALRKALKGLNIKPESLIHHSDRGIQYCSREYTKMLKTNKIRISMTEQADPYENALAERMNRTLKEEFALDRTFLSVAQARQLVKEAIGYYNHVRPHASCGYRTPEQAHHCQGPFVKMWRPAKRKSLEKVQDQLSYAYA